MCHSCHVPRMVLNSSHVSGLLTIHHKSMRPRYYSYLHFTNEKLKPKKGKWLAKAIQVLKGKQDLNPNNLVPGSMLRSVSCTSIGSSCSSLCELEWSAVAKKKQLQSRIYELYLYMHLCQRRLASLSPPRSGVSEGGARDTRVILTSQCGRVSLRRSH